MLYNDSLIHNAFAFRLLPAYENKESFGDMDILINTKFIPMNIDEIKEIYRPNEVFCEKNSNTVSFDYKELQIDFIFVDNENFESSYNYYSYNDLGNLIGKLANNFRLSYGHYGLKKIIYEEKNHSKILNEIYISKDMKRICNFLDLSYDNYKRGFNELEDIFKFVISSNFFCKESFDFENLNHQNRTRNRKRKTYQDFINYISNIQTEKKNLLQDKDFALLRINEYFPEIKIYEQIKLANEKEITRKKIKEKFNGSIVKEITGLDDGEKLGKFITFFKSLNEPFDEYVLNSDEEKIKIDIKIISKKMAIGMQEIK